MKHSLTVVFFIILAAVPLPAQDAAVSLFWKAEDVRPFAVAFDGKGSMYIVTAPPTGSGLLSRLSPDGTREKIAVMEGTFIGPGIDIDGDGTVYVTVGDKLVAVDRKGGVQPVAAGFRRCFDVKLDHRGALYVADDLADAVYRIRDGERELVYQGGLSGAFVLTSLAFDRAHRVLYIREGGTILKLKTDGPPAGLLKTEIVVDGIGAFSLCLWDETPYVTVTAGSVCRVSNKAAVPLKTTGLLLRTPIGIAAGGKGFDGRSLFVATADGIVRLTPENGATSP